MAQEQEPLLGSKKPHQNRVDITKLLAGLVVWILERHIRLSMVPALSLRFILRRVPYIVD
ncbi:hypothetical protein N7533_001570 [Penicillium manginii]|uniref:uncharacterized protein n=1 Tax=Penicillium manginii TaxID=203109 RepID=UPI002548602D|nr:uncharacterized protein N7533_001570 [Penicillium manginii]KAJ5762889.1 hypothetical protein N7533_001570 [Penicillium manginii]